MQPLFVVGPIWAILFVFLCHILHSGAGTGSAAKLVCTFVYTIPCCINYKTVTKYLWQGRYGCFAAYPFLLKKQGCQDNFSKIKAETKPPIILWLFFLENSTLLKDPIIRALSATFVYSAVDSKQIFFLQSKTVVKPVLCTDPGEGPRLSYHTAEDGYVNISCSALRVFPEPSLHLTWNYG